MHEVFVGDDSTGAGYGWNALHAAIRAVLPNTARLKSGAVAPHRIHQSRAHDYVGGRRQLLKAEPSDVVVFLGSDVRWLSLPVTHKPSAQEGAVVHAFVAADMSTQTTPLLPSWSAIAVSEGASLSSTTVPPAATAAAIRCSAASGAT